MNEEIRFVSWDETKAYWAEVARDIEKPLIGRSKIWKVFYVLQMAFFTGVISFRFAMWFLYLV